MIRFLKWLFLGDSHLHRWKIIKVVDMRNSANTSNWTRYTLQCEHCGDLKFKDSSSV